jgi:hypothetical protein
MTNMAQMGTESVSARMDDVCGSPYSSSKTHLVPKIPAVTVIKSPSASPSRPRASTTGAAQERRVSRPKSSSVDLSSRDSSQSRYSLHPGDGNPRMWQEEKSSSKPRTFVPYIEEVFHSSNSDLVLVPKREAAATPESETGQQLTPSNSSFSSRLVTNPIGIGYRPLSSNSENCEAEKVGFSDSPDNARSKLKLAALPNRSSDVPEAIADVVYSNQKNSTHSWADLPQCASDKDDDMEDEECEFDESEDDSFEERWVRTDDNFEARVFRATENDFDLATRLAPHLYDLFREEESPVVGFWSAAFQQCAANSHENSAGKDGGEFESLSYGTNHRTILGKRKKREKDDENEEGDDKQERHGQDDGSNGGGADGSHPLLLACPFNKSNPSKYNGSSISPQTKKFEYRTCDSGYKNEQRFK